MCHNVSRDERVDGSTYDALPTTIKKNLLKILKLNSLLKRIFETIKFKNSNF